MRALIAAFVLLAAAGCSRGPGTDALKSGLGERIAQALPPGTVALASFSRRGSQSDTKAPAGETRRIVYFDAELKLERDFDFGAWDAPGVAGLVSALGAGPKGITGITSGGNKAGDVLRAHGAALYKREGDRWAVVASGGFRPTVAPSYATNAPQGAAAILDAMRKVMESVQKDASPEQIAVIEEELAAAHSTIRARLARVAAGYAIAAGPEHGQYLRFVQALSDGTRDRVLPLVTRGGDENIRLLRSGKVVLALAQGDAALDAYEGRGSFSAEGPYPTLRAVGSLYPEPVHVLVRADSDLSSLADLKERRVAVGVQGSASRITALRVMQAHGLGPKGFTPVELALGEALVALRSKEVDAVIQVIGMPADAIRDALDEVPLRLLPLSERAVVALLKSKRGYFAYSIPRGAYANQKQDARTIATAALLLASPDLSESEVGAVTRFVFEKGRDLVVRGSAQGAQVAAATARHGLSIPMHVAAAKALASIK
jgi:TRAP transporter TAXI family solute receptor